ncbi:MAG TPA: DUF1127 domain-containing protein [Bradyrhizobium sp.]|nr:DUF1127 domain-containing protein [Bradyrhizobium sp.]
MSLVHSGFRANHIGQMAVRAATSVQMIWTRYRRRRLRARELAELRAMDDMALKDIGISRLDIRAAIRSGTNLSSGRE